MSEPQHPKREGTQTGVGQSGSIAAANDPALRGREAPEPAFFDSLAAAGARLAQLRQARDWSVDDVSARLKVPAAKIRALEAGDISNLPGTTFALGVVRSYAKMLGVDAAPFAQALRREKGEPEPDLSMPASTGTDLPRGRVSVSLGGTPRHRSWWWGVAAVVVALIALVMWHSGGEPPAWFTRLKASANGAVANSSGPSTTAQGQTVASGAANVAENAASDANVRAMPTPEAASGAQAAMGGTVPTSAAVAAAPASSAESLVPPQAAVPAEPAAPPQAPAPEASTATPAPKAPAVAPTASASEPSQAAAAADASGTSVAVGTSTVAFTATQDSWFSVRDKNGKEVFSGIVHAGDTKQVQGEQPFNVVAGNRSGVGSITLDGKPVDAAKYATAKGNVSRFSLP